MGYESDARKILIAKQDDLRKYGRLSGWGRAGKRFLGFTMGHGWRPWRSAMPILPIILLGWGLFYWANNIDVMQPSKERVYMSKGFKTTGVLPPEYPVFNFFAYSIDAFVPFVDLHQEDYYLPDANKPNGGIFRWYLWFHIALGWVFSTLTAVSLTGLIRKE